MSTYTNAIQILMPQDKMLMTELARRFRQDTENLKAGRNTKNLDSHGIQCPQLTHIRITGRVLTDEKKVLGWALHDYFQLKPEAGPIVLTTKSIEQGYSILLAAEQEAMAFSKTVSKVLFKDVAGCNDAKEEVMEFVRFHKDPVKYEEIGARMPKGALLVDPPGTGKTLLAKAIAGESDVPFLSISGSDFVQTVARAGPSRVRKLFEEVLLVLSSSTRLMHWGSNDERERTLNQLLVEMDGFATNVGVVVIACTNMPQILDKALLRSGRVDRQIMIDKPDLKGREEIFTLYLTKARTEKEVSYCSQSLAALTPGFSGADIAYICNEAAIIAARGGSSAIKMKHFDAAIERVFGGFEMKRFSEIDRELTAYHESGHVVAAWFLEHAQAVVKVTIVPRVKSLGCTRYLPKEDHTATKEQYFDRACVALGGRAAEEFRLSI